jgi:hypothetical protein
MLNDARKLTTKGQELLRLQIVDSVINKRMTKSESAKFFNVSRYSVHKFTSLY